MLNNDFSIRNTALLTLADVINNNHKNISEEKVEQVLSAYRTVDRDQLMQHYGEFASPEELEYYAHKLAERNQEIESWE